MRVTMKYPISGTRNGVAWPGKGESIDLPDDEAAQVIAIGAAFAASGSVAAPEAPEAGPVAETTDAIPEGEQTVATPAKAPRTRKARG